MQKEAKNRYRVIDGVRTVEGVGEVMTYGIEVAGEEGTCRVPDITTSGETAEQFCLFLQEHDVSPLHLKDIVEDMLGCGRLI